MDLKLDLLDILSNSLNSFRIEDLKCSYTISGLKVFNEKDEEVKVFGFSEYCLKGDDFLWSQHLKLKLRKDNIGAAKPEISL